MNYEIIKLKPENCHKCANIWDMAKRPEMAKRFYDELISGNREIYVYSINGEHLGEGAIVYERDGPDYSISGRRIYLSRLIVKSDCQNQGIGGILIDYLSHRAIEMGYKEITVGVNKDNEGALRLYRRKGFDEIIFDGADEYGPYYKLLKQLETH